jgi:prepilin-type N-terminal cleavage/methylation domain-containing protein
MTNNRDGFSLLEVMISIVILALMTIAVINNTKNSFEIKEEVTKEDRDFLKFFTALSLMKWDIQHLYSPAFFEDKFNMTNLGVSESNNSNAQNDKLNTIKRAIEQNINGRYRNNPNFFIPSKNGIPIPRFTSSDKSTIKFFTNSNRKTRAETKESQYAWVVYRLEDPEDEDIEYLKEFENKEEVNPGKNLVRYRLVSDPFTGSDLDLGSIKGQVIMDKVESLEFSFWNPQNEQFTSQSDIKDGQYKIEAIRMKLTYLDMNDNPITRVNIFRVGLGNHKTKEKPPTNNSARNGNQGGRNGNQTSGASNGGNTGGSP